MKDFEHALQEHFPGTISMVHCLKQTSFKLAPFGFHRSNTFACVSTCRDEIAKPLLDETNKVWGEVFDFSSLAGSLTLGKTGFAAASSHAPVIDGVERYIFIAMPHIAISARGEIGIVYREGRSAPSHACGALEAVLDEINQGKLHLQMEMDDIELSILKTKLFENLSYGEKPDLVRITKVTHDIILKDLERLIAVADKDPFDYAILTGVLIHGPMETNYIWPHTFYTVSSQDSSSKQKLSIE